MAENEKDIQDNDAAEAGATDAELAAAEVETSDDAPADDALPADETAPADDVEAEAAAPTAAPKPKGKPSVPVSVEERQERRLAERARKAAQRQRFRARAKTRRAEQRKTAPPVEADHAPEHGPGRPKTRQGVVLSAKADKTISVRIDVARRHPRYHKIMRTSSTLHAHDERNDANAGDTVRVVECRPMSRSKRWRLVEILERAR